LSGNSVTGYFYNRAENPNCSDDIYVLIFGSRQNPETSGWLKSQSFVKSQTVNVPQGAVNYKIQIDVPNGDFCWYQVDATRTGEVRIPPTYSGVDMIDYVFVKDADSCNPASPTPTPTPTSTPIPTPTPTTTTENKQEQSQTQNNNQTVNINTGGQVLSAKTPTKQPDTGVGVLGFATMFTSAPVGLFLARFRKGRISTKNLSNGEFASNVFETRIQKQSDPS
jgi:hypothetical protein